jgi:hypothetical protein
MSALTDHYAGGVQPWTVPVKKAGFISRLDNTISFNAGTRTISVTPTGTDFGFYVDGVLWTKTSAQSVTWADTEGIWFFYFDATGTLQATNDVSLWLVCIENGCGLVSAIYWDATNNAILRQLDERHGADRNRQWHLWAHKNLGCQWTSGAAITATLPDSDGSTTDSPKITIAEGACADEDIGVNAPSQTSIPIFYLLGSGSSSSDIVVSGASDSAFDGTYVYGGTETVSGFVRAYYSKAGNTHHISADSTGFNYWCLYAGTRTNPTYTSATYVRLQASGVTGLYQDLFLTISALASPASATSTPPWRMKTADAYPIVQSGATVSGGTYTGANALPAYNKDTAGTWSLTEVPNGAYFAVHYFETTDLTSDKYIGYLGQTYWMDLNDARRGAVIEMGTLKNLSSSLIAESVEIGTVLFRAVVDATSIMGYDNATHASVISIDPLQSLTYMDWRKNGLTRGINAEEFLRTYEVMRRQAFYDASDFMSSTSSSQALYAASPTWAGLAITSGTIAIQAGSANHPGVLILKSAAGASSGYCHWTVLNAFAFNGYESTEFIFQTLSSVTTGIRARFGFGDLTLSTSNSNSLAFYLSGSSGTWSISAQSIVATADNSPATAKALSTSAWYNASLRVNGAKTFAEFELWDEGKVNLLFRAVATTLPTAVLGHGFSAVNTGTSAINLVNVDFMNLSIPKAMVR